MTAPPHRAPPKPWPMKWIVLVIAVFIVGYTAVNFWFRKPGPGYRPYQDAQDRATTARLLAAGWQKIPHDLRRPVEKPDWSDLPATVTRTEAGLGDLAAKFAEKPRLLASIDRVSAPATVQQGETYHAYFTASVTDQKAQLGELDVYRRGNELVLVPGTERLPGKDLMSRWNDASYEVSFSTATLPPGRYTARLVAQGPAAAWSFSVR